MSERGSPDQQRALLMDLIDHVRWLSQEDEDAVSHIVNAVDTYMRWEGLREESLVLELLPQYRVRESELSLPRESGSKNSLR